MRAINADEKEMFRRRHIRRLSRKVQFLNLKYRYVVAPFLDCHLPANTRCPSIL